MYSNINEIKINLKNNEEKIKRVLYVAISIKITIKNILVFYYNLLKWIFTIYTYKNMISKFD